MMKAIIKFDFLQMFLYEQDIDKDDIVEVDYENITEWDKGDEVEVLKIVESEEFSGGKAYIIFNPKNKKSVSVAHHVIEIIS